MLDMGMDCRYVRLRFSLNNCHRLAQGLTAVFQEAPLPVELLGSGEWGDVAEVTGEPGWVGRLAELGVRAGSRLRMLQPGSPCLLEVGPCRLSLRAELATQILVRPVPQFG